MYIPSLQAQLIKYSFDHNKEVFTETKVVSRTEFLEIVHHQRKLAQRLESSKKYALVAEEVREGLDKAFHAFYVIDEHLNYELLTVEYPITKYKDQEYTIEFMSGKVTISKVKAKNGDWIDYDEDD